MGPQSELVDSQPEYSLDPGCLSPGHHFLSSSSLWGRGREVMALSLCFRRLYTFSHWPLPGTSTPGPAFQCTAGTSLPPPGSSQVLPVHSACVVSTTYRMTRPGSLNFSWYAPPATSCRSGNRALVPPEGRRERAANIQPQSASCHPQPPHSQHPTCSPFSATVASVLGPPWHRLPPFHIPQPHHLPGPLRAPG